MPSLSLFNRRDPWWESDGPAARRARRRRGAMNAAAFAAALVAVGASALAWSIQLGVAGAIGIHAALPLG
ncbi:MAG TPA: hypothetical protein VFQ75_13605 [Candidatus Limnocylindrales bacterium]|nr:hypothetical protein [Candidatus Limnocylindrales bacterium]